MPVSGIVMGIETLLATPPAYESVTVKVAEPSEHVKMR
jgi:hypothetical protein